MKSIEGRQQLDVLVNPRKQLIWFPMTQLDYLAVACQQDLPDVHSVW